MSPYIIDIHETAYIESKGIWTIESTVKDLYKALADVETSLKVLPEVSSKDYLNTYDDFLAPQ
eukprot:95384-Ditylum_brightwellii.AAC.1